MKFIPSRLHGFIDYATALILILAPLVVLPAVGIAKWLSIAAGVGLIIYSLITDYSVSARKAISFRLHLTLDFLAGIVFVAAPFVFGFSGLVKNYYLVIGITVILVVLFTKNDIDS